MNQVHSTLSSQSRDEEVQAAIENYLQARKRILTLGREVPERFGGNDNIIGRIGEFIGLRFLESLGQRPEKVPGTSNPGYDLEEGSCRTQVKAITQENKHGRSVRLTPDWTQFLLIELGEHYVPTRIGLLTLEQQQQAIVDGFAKTPTPVVSLTMLGTKGLFSRYGRVYGSKQLRALGL
ncbi:hypothetical protein [Halomonas sp. BC04]|uniref:hypothetical protein n=1 Tax=Halomonas sp. BC04 TaxID=1403540 RepID=UPI0003ED7B15|nr:hypothetical protein [Halomonas sp. BC04]EWH03239.1 hypothetical protein Q427_04380 [Halomonas sp. BC04]